MLSLRQCHRAGVRRACAVALFTVAVVASSVLVLSAPPASADPPPDFDSTVTRAINDARRALERPECERLLSGPLGSALDVLNTSSRRFVEVPPAPLSPDAAASVSGRGLNQPITFYPGFFRFGTTSRPDGSQVILQPRLGGRPEFSAERLNTDASLLRALTVLHEVGHLTLRELDHEGNVDDFGRPLPPDAAEGFYNTRILNTCFAPRYLIRAGSCVHNFFSTITSTGSIDCFAVCRPDAGPVVVAWTTPLQSTISTDTSADSCQSTMVSGCPPPTSTAPNEITLTVTDATGHVSSDTFRVTCFSSIFW
jgi:hypothetical protein